MAGFPLGGGGGSGRDSPPSPPGVHPSDFLYATRAGGFQLWGQPQDQHQHQHQQLTHPFYASNLIRFAPDDLPTAAAAHSLAGGASSSSSRGARAAAAAGLIAGGASCQDCGNQAKKDCTHQRCRTCCKSRGFACATHVKSTWVPASKRRERQQQLSALASAVATAGGAGPSRDLTKRPRARIANTTTSSGDQQMVTVAERFPREVSSEAVFRCVRLGPMDQAEAELAYQTTVSIGGHVFKGILHDVGPSNAQLQAAAAAAAAGGGSSGDYQFRLTGDASPPSTGGDAGGGSGGGNNVVVSSAVVMDPYPTPGMYGSFVPATTPFFHGHPYTRQ
ncbi:protein SHORT INTERNODES 1 [Lolium perenne]|uniref:protein SHORT INTERNODES 1 n=1 Tax=Lolium perenne TaxID=4522 RepID=UPI0021EB0B93|nr:protein SHORT INTERNODES 1-like [Lolium perenne]